MQDFSDSRRTPCGHPMGKVIAEHCDPCGRPVTVEFSCGECFKKAQNTRIKEICAGLLILAPFSEQGICIKAFCGGAPVECEVADSMVVPLERVCAVEVGAREADGCSPCPPCPPLCPPCPPCPPPCPPCPPCPQCPQCPPCPPCPPSGGPPVTGPVSTGPFFVRTGQNNAINVKVQNTSNTPIDARVILIGLDCPANNPLQAVTLTNIPGGCCADDAVVTAGAGNFEVVVCPDPADAPIRVFVSVHSGNAPTSNIEYVIRGSEMLAPVCGACSG